VPLNTVVVAVAVVADMANSMMKSMLFILDKNKKSIN
jgi:hypothetical protein